MRRVYGRSVYHESFDNSFSVEIFAYKKQGGEYRRMPYKLSQQPFCDFFNSPTFQPYYEEVVETSDLPPFPMPCPFGNVSKEMNCNRKCYKIFHSIEDGYSQRLLSFIETSSYSYHTNGRLCSRRFNYTGRERTSPIASYRDHCQCLKIIFLCKLLHT